MKTRLPLRTLLAALLLAAVATGARAQRTYRPRFSVGAHAGMTMSRMSFAPKVDQKFANGVIAGVRARYAEESHVGIIAELNIEQRGWAEKYESGEPFSYRRTLTYLQLPLMTHIFVGSDRFKGFLNLGPEVGYMIASSVSANFDWRNVGSVAGYPGGWRENEQLALEVSNRFDYGIAAGLGMEWRVNRRNAVSLEGRFYYGLGNIFPSAKRDHFAASRGMSIEITAGYWFRLR